MEKAALFSLPSDISIIPVGHGAARIYIRRGESRLALDIPGVFGELRQACELSKDRLVAFGADTLPLYNIELLDRSKGLLLDSFYGYNPLVSPDKRLLIVRRFFPLHGVNASDQYFIYDLARNPAANRNGDEQQADITAPAGTLVYPVAVGSRVPNNTGLPEDQVHAFRSEGFFWSTNSKAVVFADSVANRLSIVLVLADGKGFNTYLYPVPTQKICSSQLKGTASNDAITLSDAEVTAEPDGTYSVHGYFSTASAQCRPTPLNLPQTEFSRAAVENHTETPRKKSIMERK